MVRVLARHGDQDVAAKVERDDDTVTVTIGERAHVFRLGDQTGGRLELETDGKPHVVEVDGVDLRVDGLPYDLEVRKAPPDVPGATRGAGGAGGVTKIKPPMPGKIVKVAVSEGDHVQPGDLLVVLEAMKMQNEIVSPVEGTIKTLGVQEGENINATKVVCEIE